MHLTNLEIKPLNAIVSQKNYPKDIEIYDFVNKQVRNILTPNWKKYKGQYETGVIKYEVSFWAKKSK